MKASTVVGRGEKSLLCDPGSELRLWRERDSSAKIINGMEQKNKKIKKYKFQILEQKIFGVHFRLPKKNN